ncbi:MAG: TonB-dependent receptor, partial [Bacteroidota bacterium]
DKVNRYTGVPATDWDNPQPLEGFSFQQSTLLSPGWDDRDHNLGGLYTYNPQNGIKTQELSAQLNVDLAVGAWRLTNRLKYSDKDVDWQTVIGGQPLGLENFLTYFISGDPFPAGLVTFTDVVFNQQLATVDNNEAFGVFQGLPPGFSYTQGTLPNDAIMASGAWKKDDSIDEWMNELRLSADWNDVQLTVGSFAALSDVDVFTNASFLYSTYEDESRPLRVQLENPGEPIRDLSDRFGVSNYGGLFYEAASIEVGQIAVFSDATLKLTTPLTANVGLRYERINHSGSKDRSAQDPIEGGLDGNPLTSYDAAPLIAGDTDPIDFSYDYLSYSAGLSYDLGQNHSLFARHSVGNKAPELNYYMDNFANQPVDGPAPIQSVTQSELGFVSNQRDYGIQIIGFYSQLDDVPYTNFAFDESTNQIFYSPTQLNSASSIGIEVNTSVWLTKSLSLNASGTFQNANLDEFTLYDANESIATEDDEIRSFDDNTPTHNPGILGRIGLVYEEADWYVDLHWNHTGQRQGNLSNDFQLPSYSTVDMNVGYALSDRWSIGVRGRNILNTAGLQNFFGPNQFGSNSDAASEAFINENPNGSFVVFPIMPRTIFLTIEFAFSK